MTLRQLYEKIDGSYEQALKVMRVDKLIDKHIRRFPTGVTAEALVAAGNTMDPTALFESAHAMKGVCANLGLIKLYEAASEIAEEFRPGKTRKFDDEQVKQKIAAIKAQYEKTVAGIREYEQTA